MLPLRKIGLTGGIASGKTAVAGFLRDSGVAVVDLDELGRAMTANDSALQRKLDRIAGGGLIGAHGFDRGKLRDRVFAKPKVRKGVEALLHPLILKKFENEAALMQKKGYPLVVCEAALLVETGHYQKLDELIVVVSPETSRRERLLARGMSETLIDQILSAQSGDAQKTKVATHILKNSGTLDDLRTGVKTIVDGWKKKS